MSSRLAARLIGDRALPEATVRAAAARQLVYGGGLDTALLEMKALDEAAIWARLAEATGLPVPEPSLYEGTAADEGAAEALSSEASARLGAVPVARHEGVVDLLCIEPVAEAEIRSAVTAAGLAARLFVVPEARLAAARARVYGEPVPARLAPLLARLVGAAERRRRRPQPPQPVRPPEGEPSASVVGHPGAPAAATVDAGGAPERTPLERVLDLVGPMTVGPPLEDEVDRAPDRHQDRPQDRVEARTQDRAEDRVPDREKDREKDREEDRQAIPEHTPEEEPSTPSGAIRDLEGATPMMPMPEDSSGPGPRLAVESAPAAAAPAPGAAEGGRGRARTRAEEVAAALNDAATESLCRRARDDGDKGRTQTLRALRQRHAHPTVQALLRDLRRELGEGAEEIAARAAVALGELRELQAIPALIERLVPATSPLAAAAHAALVDLTAQDFGNSQRRWEAWWQHHREEHRVLWLIAGLTNGERAIRGAAADELRQIAGDSFGYDADRPRADREEAQRRARAWWEETGRARLATPVPPSVAPGGDSG